VLIISFDGMQSGKFEEFLRDNPNAAFNEIINDGVKAEYMIPSFPTLTFPNHYTIVTGIYIYLKILLKNIKQIFRLKYRESWYNRQYYL
jgi:hypothetical protein